MLTDLHKKIIQDAIHIVGDTTKDWFAIKLQIIYLFPAKERKNFSRRHYSSKKHTINDFDKQVMDFWEKESGIKLEIDESKLHPKDWNPNKKGWGLKKYNDLRKNKTTFSK